jgi:hypothetical protein
MTSSASPGLPMNTTSSAWVSALPRTRSKDPVREAPAVPQDWTQSSFATAAGEDAMTVVAGASGAAGAGTGVGVGAGT